LKEYITGQNINIRRIIIIWYLKEGIDLFVADNAQIKQPHLVEGW
jgi:hypothetical protein